MQLYQKLLLFVNNLTSILLTVSLEGCRAGPAVLTGYGSNGTG